MRYSMGLDKPAQAIEAAVRRVLDEKKFGGSEFRTKDLGGTVSTTQMGDKILEALKETL